MSLFTVTSLLTAYVAWSWRLQTLSTFYRQPLTTLLKWQVLFLSNKNNWPHYLANKFVRNLKKYNKFKSEAPLLTSTIKLKGSRVWLLWLAAWQSDNTVIIQSLQGRLNQWAHWARAQGRRIFFFLTGPNWLWWNNFLKLIILHIWSTWR